MFAGDLGYWFTRFVNTYSRLFIYDSVTRNSYGHKNERKVGNTSKL